MALPFTRKIIEDWAGRETFAAGMRLFEAGRVQRVEWQAPLLSGEIEKAPRPLKTRVSLSEDGQIRNQCPCPDNRIRGLVCAHAVALCLDLLKAWHDPQRKAKLELEQRRAKRLAEIDESAYLNRVPANTLNAVSATLVLELAGGWRKAFRNQGMISVEPRVQYGDAEDLIPDVPRDLPLALQERDENLLFVLEDIAEGPVGERVEIKGPDFMTVLDLLRDGGLVDGDSGAWLEVSRDPVDSHLVLDLDRETGDLLLWAETECPHMQPGTFPEHLVSRGRGWAVGSESIHPLESLLPEPLHGVYHQPVVITRDKVPAFLGQELPLLRQVTEVETEIAEELFQFDPARPAFHLVVKGSPASLSATLFASYGEGQEVLAGKPDAASDFARPDPDDLLRYEVRNPEAELRAVERLAEFGFVGERGDQLSRVVGTGEVLNFLGGQLPGLRRLGWKVDLEGSVAEFIDDLDYATPVVSVERGGGGGGAGWFEVGFQFEDRDGESLSQAEIQRALRMGESFVKSGNRTILFDRDAVESLGEVFYDCSAGEGSSAGTFRVSDVHAGYVQSSLQALDNVDVEATPEWMQRAESENRGDTGKLEPVKLPDHLEPILRDYQRTGVSWLRRLERQNYGGILADEMGLGKTLQTLTWMELPREQEGIRDLPGLIVCPTSLVENWIEEAERFTPELVFLNATGSKRADALERMDEVDVVVTSYALIRRDLEHYTAREFAFMVLDEAQHIKNRNTQNAQAAKQVRAYHRLVLTGTPVENSVSDLWSIMDFLMPGYLGPHKQFKELYEVPIGGGGAPAERAQAKLRRKLHPFLLRRLKKDVAKDLPPKIIKVSSCGMTGDQRLVYQELVKSAQDTLSDLVASQGFERARMEVFKTLLRLRQAACHLELLKLPGPASKRPSGKLDLFLELMEEAVDGGHRVLVFSQFTTMLKILARELEAKGLSYCYLDGSTKDRMGQVRKFNGDASIPAFLISLKAGGTGLNLTGADMVIHFDPWWNPAVEDQATDRAYRIGQKRTVYSLKLITKGTVEEKVLALQQKKKAVIDATLGTEEEAVLESLTWDDVQDLLAL